MKKGFIILVILINLPFFGNDYQFYCMHWSYQLTQNYWFSLELFILITKNSAHIFLLKFNSRNIRKRFEKCSKFTIETPERRQNMFKVNDKDKKIVNFKHILTSFWCLYCESWAYFTLFSNDYTVYFEQVNVCWEVSPNHAPSLELIKEHHKTPNPFLKLFTAKYTTPFDHQIFQHNKLNFLMESPYQ